MGDGEVVGAHPHRHWDMHVDRDVRSDQQMDLILDAPAQRMRTSNTGSCRCRLERLNYFHGPAVLVLLAVFSCRHVTRTCKTRLSPDWYLVT